MATPKKKITSARTPGAESEAIPESRRFNDAETGNEPSEIESLHFDGVPFEDLDLETQKLMRALPNAKFASDEHVDRLRFHSPEPTRPERARVENQSGDVGAQIAQRRDFRADDDNDIDAAPDPLRTLSERYVQPGFRPRFLSEARLNKEGSIDSRGYEVVKDGNGNPVKFGSMVLGQMPEERAQAINDRAVRRSDKAAGEIYARGKERGLTPETEMKRTRSTVVSPFATGEDGDFPAAS